MRNKRRPSLRTWLAHEAEMARNERALSNTTSRHLAKWRMCPEEDAALAELPQRLRQYLTHNTIEIMPPTEALANERLHGGMLRTLMLINLALILEHYGPQHPSISKLTQETTP